MAEKRSLGPDADDPLFKKIKTEPSEFNGILDLLQAGGDGASFNAPQGLSTADLQLPTLYDHRDIRNSKPEPHRLHTLLGIPHYEGPPNVLGTPTSKARAVAEDPAKMNDALAAAGVDVQRELELLAQQQAHRAASYSYLQTYRPRPSQLGTFLSPYHVAPFMQKVARENGILQNFNTDPELLELMSVLCHEWLSGLVEKTIALARHRRRGVPALVQKGKKTSVSTAPRSELSKELRNLAVRQKELEERRVSKRIALGLEKNADSDAANGKAGAEETLHRAANATAAMMTMNPGRKKYLWMTADAGGGGGGESGAVEDKEKGKQSSLISVRGDNGLRFREIRLGNLVTMKDLLGVIEDERVGTEKAVLKGYAKLKD